MDRFTTHFPAPKPISTAMHRAKSVDGPMSLLRSFYTRRMRVHITIRGSHAIRSILSGYLLAFDKHWNMILHDVDESYLSWECHRCGRDTIAKLREQGARWRMAPSNKRRGETTNAAAAAQPTTATDDNTHIWIEYVKQRHMHQLYVRGDSIVAVTENKPTLPRYQMEQEEK